MFFPSVSIHASVVETITPRIVEDLDIADTMVTFGAGILGGHSGRRERQDKDERRTDLRKDHDERVVGVRNVQKLLNRLIDEIVNRLY